VAALVSAAAVSASAQSVGTIRVEVTAAGVALPGATVIAAAVTAVTDAGGAATLTVPAGVHRLVVQSPGFFDAAEDLTVEAGRELSVMVSLVERPELSEEFVVVASTRTGRRLEDQPSRVEVLGREEIEEKMLMTPGDIVMMLNEMGGLRVQATSPAIGAAAVRVQGMKGRYTRFFSDGLPLFGQQVGGLGLLQTPPMDLGQVEVIKGVASSLYGAGAMGGVVNLLSRRPAKEAQRELLVNQSTLGATDAVAFIASPQGSWSTSLLASGHRQTRVDRDDDEWADVAGYGRGVLRPRLLWEGENGRSAFVTAGLTYEDREGGTMNDAVLEASGLPYRESLDTRRYDVGGTMQALLSGRFVLTARAAAAWQRHEHVFGDVIERDAHDSVFGELAIRGATGGHTWVGGAAFERDKYRPRDVPQFAYTFDVPGLFAQDDIDLAPWLSLSIGARLDQHSDYGTFLSPRVAALIRRGAWTSRLSVGRGFFPSTVLTEDTEAAGLSRLRLNGDLEPERGTSVSADLTRQIGVVSVTATLFGSRVSKPVLVEREKEYALFNAADPSANLGGEVLATWRAADFVGTGTYTYVRSRETGLDGRQDAPLTPRHSAGLVAMWEVEGKARVGVEVYYTGRQRLEANPYRSQSRPYVSIGLLGERRVGPVRLFLNAENITDSRQTRWDTLLRPTQGADGRWTVDAWAPLDGRVLNGGVRFGF